jgi:hypothetical protein
MALFWNKRFLRPISIFLLCLFLTACLTETPPAEPTATLDPTQTAIPSATIDWFPATATKPSPTQTSVPVQVNPAPPTREEILIEDDFSDESLWQTRNEVDAKISFEPNALSVVVSGEKTEAYSISTHPLPDTFFLEFTVETALCSNDDQYGIIFWRNSSSGTYRFWANCQGQIMVDKVLPEGITRLVNWESARKFIPNAPARNVFGIQSMNGQLDFFINDSYQFSIQARANLEGAIGLIARTASDADLTVRFSNLIVSKPKP